MCVIINLIFEHKESIILGGDAMTLKRYQVFVSSTYRDLIDERAAVTNCILDNDCIPVGMEQFPAMPISQWEYIKKMIDSSDYYLLIVAGKYGSIDPQSGLSYTEKEFQYALDQNIPIIAFLNKDIEKLPCEKCEDTEEGRKNIERFRQTILNSNYLCDFYTSIDGLKYAVAKSLRKTIEECPAVGWVRSDQIDNFQTKTIERLQDILLMMKNTQMEECNSLYKAEEKQSINAIISKEAITLLREACRVEANGVIIVSRSLCGTSISAGRQVFCDDATSRLEAIWVGAVDELEKNGYIQDASGKQEIYRVTRRGYDYNDKTETEVSSLLREKGYDNVDIAIINTIRVNEKCNIDEISQVIGYSRASTAMRIKKLQDKGVLVKEGNARLGKWIVCEENI